MGAAFASTADHRLSPGGVRRHGQIPHEQTEPRNKLTSLHSSRGFDPRQALLLQRVKCLGEATMACDRDSRGPAGLLYAKLIRPGQAKTGPGSCDRLRRCMFYPVLSDALRSVTRPDTDSHAPRARTFITCHSENQSPCWSGNRPARLHHPHFPTRGASALAGFVFGHPRHDHTDTANPALLTAADLCRMFEEAEDASANARKEAERDCDYVDGRQWSATTLLSYCGGLCRRLRARRLNFCFSGLGWLQMNSRRFIRSPPQRAAGLRAAVPDQGFWRPSG